MIEDRSYVQLLYFQWEFTSVKLGNKTWDNPNWCRPHLCIGGSACRLLAYLQELSFNYDASYLYFTIYRLCFPHIVHRYWAVPWIMFEYFLDNVGFSQILKQLVLQGCWIEKVFLRKVTFNDQNELILSGNLENVLEKDYIFFFKICGKAFMFLRTRPVLKWYRVKRQLIQDDKSYIWYHVLTDINFQ